MLNERLKLLRRELHLSQEEFGKRVGVSNTAISKLEKAERNLTEQMILSITREFNVNENWLRTGEGDMFNKTTPDEDLAFFMGQLLSKKDDTPKKIFFRAMSKLPDELFLELIKAIEDEYKKSE